MTRRHGTAVGAVALSAILLVLSGTQAIAATPATVTGKLGSGAVKLPKSEKQGSAQVLAMNVDSLAFGDAAPVARSGRYALKLPAGKWSLHTTVVALGKPYVSFSSAKIKTRSGQRRSLPLTLKRFKKPRKKARRKRRARRAIVANINPRDGREYAGEAFGFEAFNVTAVDPDLRTLSRGAPDMLITDVLNSARCPFTIVEWMRRDAVLSENAFSGSEHIDPATRIEPGHIIDPEILIRGRIEDRPGTPKRVAQVAWLVDAKTGARLSGNVSTVSLHDVSIFDATARLAVLIERDLICARANRPAPAPPPAPPVGSPPPPPPPPPSPPLPPQAPNSYSGTFSGNAVSAFIDWTWTGVLHLDAADDSPPFFPPPNGGPPGSYRTFTVGTPSSIQMSVEVRDVGSSCTWTGSRELSVAPQPFNTLVLQLDVPNPAYALHITGDISETIALTPAPSCDPASPIPIYERWLSSGPNAHTSPSLTLDDTEADVTPSPFDYDSTTRWNLAPG